MCVRVTWREGHLVVLSELREVSAHSFAVGRGQAVRPARHWETLDAAASRQRMPRPQRIRLHERITNTRYTHTPTGVRQYDTHALLAIACLWFERCELLDGLDGVVSASRRAVIHAAVVPVAHAGERAWAAKQVQRSHQNPTNTRLPNHGDGSSVQTPPLLNK